MQRGRVLSSICMYHMHTKIHKCVVFKERLVRRRCIVFRLSLEGYYIQMCLFIVLSVVIWAAIDSVCTRIHRTIHTNSPHNTQREMIRSVFRYCYCFISVSLSLFLSANSVSALIQLQNIRKQTTHV